MGPLEECFQCEETVPSGLEQMYDGNVFCGESCIDSYIEENGEEE